MKRHRKSLRPVTEINLTSILDVAFVLLIAFMIVAPSLKYGYNITLPTDTNPPAMDQQQNEEDKKPVVLSLPRPENNGVQRYMLNEDQVTLPQLEERLGKLRSKNADLTVEFQADKTVPYEMVLRAIGAARRAGVERLGLPVELVESASVTPAPQAQATEKQPVSGTIPLPTFVPHGVSETPSK